MERKVEAKDIQLLFVDAGWVNGSYEVEVGLRNYRLCPQSYRCVLNYRYAKGGETSEKVDRLHQRRPGSERIDSGRCSRTRALEENRQNGDPA